VPDTKATVNEADVLASIDTSGGDPETIDGAIHAWAGLTSRVV
jgi:hypothetical protein